MNIELNFERLMNEFHHEVSTKNDTFLDKVYESQKSLISRILTFPTSSRIGASLGGIELLKDIKADLPKAIIRNKQVFEAIFSLL